MRGALDPERVQRIIAEMGHGIPPEQLISGTIDGEGVTLEIAVVTLDGDYIIGPDGDSLTTFITIPHSLKD